MGVLLPSTFGCTAPQRYQPGLEHPSGDILVVERRPSPQRSPYERTLSPTDDMMTDRLRATTQGTTDRMTHAQGVPVPMTIVTIIKVIEPQQSPHTDFRIMGILIAKKTRHVTVITIARRRIPQALKETRIDAETTTPGLTIHAMTVRPHHAHHCARTTLSPMTGITIANGPLVPLPPPPPPPLSSPWWSRPPRPTNVMTQIVVVRTIALACRREWGSRFMSLMVHVNPKTLLIGSPEWTPTSISIVWIPNFASSTRRWDLAGKPRSSRRTSTLPPRGEDSRSLPGLRWSRSYITSMFRGNTRRRSSYRDLTSDRTSHLSGITSRHLRSVGWGVDLWRTHILLLVSSHTGKTLAFGRRC